MTSTKKGLLIGFVTAAITIAVALHIPKPRALEVFTLLLFGIAAVYLGYAFIGGGGREAIIEISNFILMAVLTFLGLWVAPYWLAIGLFAHGIWDFFHHSRVKLVPTKVPDWYAVGCTFYDWIVGAFILILWR